MTKPKRRWILFPAVLLLGGFLASCAAPLVAVGLAGAAAGTVNVAADRRPLGVQSLDEENEWRAAAQVKKQLGDIGHINYTSYNRKLLVSGEIRHQEQRAELKRLLLQHLPNVIEVWDALSVGPESSVTSRSRDTLITSKVKSRLAETSGVSTNVVKVVSENGVVYLLGIVTSREADLAVQVARTTTDVQKVVSYFEIKSDDEIRQLSSIVRKP